MKKIQKEEMIETEYERVASSSLKFGFWNEEKEEFIELTGLNEKEFNLPAGFSDAMDMFANEILERFTAINRDLKQLGAEILK